MTTPISDGGVVVVGAGQAGLAVSRGLTDAGVPHVVLEKDRSQIAGTRFSKPNPI